MSANKKNRREFLKKSAKLVAYISPLIYSFRVQAKPPPSRAIICPTNRTCPSNTCETCAVRITCRVSNPLCKPKTSPLPKIKEIDYVPKKKIEIDPKPEIDIGDTYNPNSAIKSSYLKELMKNRDLSNPVKPKSPARSNSSQIDIYKSNINNSKINGENINKGKIQKGNMKKIE